MEDEVAQVARGSAYLLAMELATNIISITAFMFMVNFLAVEEMGIYTVMWMVCLLYTSPSPRDRG